MIYKVVQEAISKDLADSIKSVDASKVSIPDFNLRAI